MGIYQMVYPLYCLLLTLAATGIPSGLCRIVAHAEAVGKDSSGILRRALLVFSLIGAAGSVLMFALAPVMSAVQREPGAETAYRMLAPGVFAVAAISCFRGYFQGKGNFFPTALSEVLEQLVKVGLGLFFAYAYRGNTVRAVAYALLAVTVSEAVAAAFMFVFYRVSKRRAPHKGEPVEKPGAWKLVPFVKHRRQHRHRAYDRQAFGQRDGAVRRVFGRGEHAREPARFRLLRAGGGDHSAHIFALREGRNIRSGEKDLLRAEMHLFRLPACGGIPVCLSVADGGVPFRCGHGGGRRLARAAHPHHVVRRGFALRRADLVRMPHGQGEAENRRDLHDRGRDRQDLARTFARPHTRNFRFGRGDCGNLLLFCCFARQFVI